MTGRLFKRRRRQKQKQTLLKSSSWPTKSIAFDYCIGGFHDECPRRWKTTLLEFTLVCACQCHDSKGNKNKNRKERKAAAAVDVYQQRSFHSFSKQQLPHQSVKGEACYL
jgi:hypothetical protein